MDLPIRSYEDGSLFACRVTPKSSKDSIEGFAEDDAGRSHLRVKVRAVPENGAANKSVCLTLAKALGLPKSAVRLHAGDTARLKQVYAEITPADLAKKLRKYGPGG